VSDLNRIPSQSYEVSFTISGIHKIHTLGRRGELESLRDGTTPQWAGGSRKQSPPEAEAFFVNFDV